MIYTNDPYYRDFLRAICTVPANDQVRLELADWLDEHSKECWACYRGNRIPNSVHMRHNLITDRYERVQRPFVAKWENVRCEVCRGTETNGAVERAEYIRLAIELNSYGVLES